MTRIPGGLLISLAAVVGLVGAGSAQGSFGGQNGDIAFVGGDGDLLDPGPFAIYSMNSDGSEVMHLTGKRNLHTPADPAFSPTGGTLAYSSSFRRPGRSGVRLMAMLSDGNEKRTLTSPADRIFDLNPSFAPTGRRIIFERQNLTNPYLRRPARIMARSRDGDVETLGRFHIPEASSADLEPIVSPDGRRIVFVYPRARQNDIWVMGADGRDPRPLIASGTPEEQPDFSPDGSLIAFSRPAPNGFSHIYISKSDGSNQTDLTPGVSHHLFDPAFSPDGTKILFSLGDLLYVMDVDGSDWMRISHDGLSARDMTWQPIP
jgi:TolB protein